jgi:hypothetical protein
MKELFQNLNIEQMSNCTVQCCYVVATAVVLWILYLIFRSKRVVIFSNEEGTASLTKNALKEIVESTVKGAGIPGKIRTNIRCCGRKMSIDVFIHVGKEQTLSEVSKVLHDSLRNAITTNIGPDTVSKINVVIAGFIGSKSRWWCCRCKHKSPCQCEDSRDTCHEMTESDNDR